MAQARYVMIGGFLGAGKTTAMLQAGRRLAARGLRVGLITNDQSDHLVDTRLLQGQGLPVEEITGGCFCCRFNSLIDAADRLSRKERPDIFLAEPVGSCTDLRASVVYPLQRLYGDDFMLAPLTVLVDPVRARRVLRLDEGRAFSAKVQYVYEKQLEEADVIAINKIDASRGDEVEALRIALASRFPDTTIALVSAREGTGIDAWIDMVLAGGSEARDPLDLDYEAYAEGEARLGWLNCTARLVGAPFDGNAWLLGVAGGVQARLNRDGIEIAHLKMTLAPQEAALDLGVLNLVRGDAAAELSHQLDDPLEAADLIVNLRAEGDPARLEQAVLDALREAAAAVEIAADVEHTACFRPPRPVPTHRMAALS